MKPVLFGLALLFHLLPVCYAIDEYESIFWDPDLFSHEVNTTLYVRLNAKINVICPSIDIVVKHRGKDRQVSTTYENVWLAFNKTSYDNCRIDKKYDPKAVLYLCPDPTKLNKIPLIFRSRSSAPPSTPTLFEGGKDYYLISTSDGTESSIHRSEGGRCHTRNMRVRIHVCEAKMSDSLDPNCRRILDPKSNICPATDPVAEPYHLTTHAPVTTLAPVTTPAPTNISEIYNDTDSDTETFTTTMAETVNARATETTSAGYNHPLPRPVELVWVIGYNQSQTEHISEAANHSLVALCEETNSKVSLLNDRGTIVDSWLCQHAGERLVILKPEYRSGDVYLFEALPGYGSVRPWKSVLTVNVDNVGSVRQRFISNADSLYHLPGFALLASMYFIAASIH